MESAKDVHSFELKEVFRFLPLDEGDFVERWNVLLASLAVDDHAGFRPA